MVDWGGTYAEAHRQTANTRLRLLQYNWLMRSYLRTAKLHQFNNNIPDICFKCEQSKETLFHCMWDSKGILTFWYEISRIIQKMFSGKLRFDPMGLYPPTLVISRNKQTLMNMCFLQAKCTVALSWQNTQRP